MRTVFISGATAGIGAAAARHFAAAGWRVVATGRRAERLAALADELGRERCGTIAADIRDLPTMLAGLAALPPEFRAIDLLIN
ncbi:SDR family NAD(P)-dependent oxidoreductase, partial [Acinetobacter baumannii]